jgi:hypothetical protein
MVVLVLQKFFEPMLRDIVEVYPASYHGFSAFKLACANH